MRKSACYSLAPGMLLRTLNGCFFQSPLCEGPRERHDFFSDWGKPCFSGLLGLFLCYRCHEAIIDDVSLFYVATGVAESQTQASVTV